MTQAKECQQAIEGLLLTSFYAPSPRIFREDFYQLERRQRFRIVRAVLVQNVLGAVQPLLRAGVAVSIDVLKVNTKYARLRVALQGALQGIELKDWFELDVALEAALWASEQPLEERADFFWGTSSTGAYASC